MYRIYGVDKSTGELVDVASADNAIEKDAVLRQEEENYDGLRAVNFRILSWPHSDGGWRARMELEAQ